MAYNGTVTLTAGITPKNNGDFALVNAHDVYVDDETRLDEALEGVNADIISVSVLLAIPAILLLYCF